MLTPATNRLVMLESDTHTDAAAPLPPTRLFTLRDPMAPAPCPTTVTLIDPVVATLVLTVSDADTMSYVMIMVAVPPTCLLIVTTALHPALLLPPADLLMTLELDTHTVASAPLDPNRALLVDSLSLLSPRPTIVNDCAPVDAALALLTDDTAAAMYDTNCVNELCRSVPAVATVHIDDATPLDNLLTTLLSEIHTVLPVAV